MLKELIIKFYILFGKTEQEKNSYKLTSEDSYQDGIPISAKSWKQLAKLELEDDYLIWDNPTVKQYSQYENGQKGAFVELFGGHMIILMKNVNLLEMQDIWLLKFF